MCLVPGMKLVLGNSVVIVRDLCGFGWSGSNRMLCDIPSLLVYV